MKEIVSTITSKGQVTIPVEVRKELGVDTRDKVVFVIDDGNVRLQPMRFTLKTVRGSVPALPGTSEDFEQEIEEAMDEEADRLLRRMGPA